MIPYIPFYICLQLFRFWFIFSFQYLIANTVYKYNSRLNDFQSLWRRCGPIHNYNFLMCCIRWRKFNFMVKWLCPLQWNVERQPIHFNKKDNVLPWWKLTNLVSICTFYSVPKCLKKFLIVASEKSLRNSYFCCYAFCLSFQIWWKR